MGYNLFSNWFLSQKHLRVEMFLSNIPLDPRRLTLYPLQEEINHAA
jgi:hypothetical protein